MRPFSEGWWQSRRQRAPHRSFCDLMGPHEGPEPQYFHICLAVDVPQSISSHQHGTGTHCRRQRLAATRETQTNGEGARRAGQRKGVSGTNRSHQRSKEIVLISLPNADRPLLPSHVPILFPKPGETQAPPCSPSTKNFTWHIVDNF